VRCLSSLPRLAAAAGLLLLAAAARAEDAPAPSPPPPAAPDTATPTAAAAEEREKAQFGAAGLAKAFADAWTTPAFVPAPPGSPPPVRRGPLPPFDSPPYPNGEWQLGATPALYAPNLTAPYPTIFMDSIYASTIGDDWKKTRFQFYGWVNVGVNASTSVHSNAPAGYIIRPNRFELNQATFYFERLPDTYQTDHFDWGFRVTGLYGLDYRFTTTKGILSDQLLVNNQIYGFDLPMFYVDFYLPWFFMGTNVRIGRYISPPDIEAQLAPDNYMYTHSLQYTFDVFTQEGILATARITPNWAVQLGITAGNDVAVWVQDHGRQVTPTFLVQWISDANNDSVYGGVNSINNQHFGYNNLQCLILSWTHKFNERVHSQFEAWYMWQAGVHPINEPVSGAQPAVDPDAVLGAPGNEFAFSDYLIVRLLDNTFLSIRNEYFNDVQGQRTGFKTQYYEGALGITYWLNKMITIRPEVRFDHAFEAAAYDNAAASTAPPGATSTHPRHSQTLFAIDVIWHY
jgi:hypothetical protein